MPKPETMQDFAGEESEWEQNEDGVWVNETRGLAICDCCSECEGVVVLDREES